ncbi:hypothetical protein L249_5793 [Ophiocordyceps polyrhachis-furcata BCC 54312]|uniref:HMG box domain-containing protein n=1 Tax=Ophiocordyceps polyrhachis-furcata BCC 54312 TaxID=1330021 RepID=A0A367L058_9HYPO|nr:hypothetical protein L249_5793 [Ophiocordyceps polyrhachis-furcata BCC 54312]
MFVASLHRVVARRALPSGLNSIAARRLVLARRAFSGSSWLRDPTTATAKKEPATKKATKKATASSSAKAKAKAKPAAKKKKAPAKAKKAAAAPKKKKKKAAPVKKKKKPTRKPRKPLTPEQREKIKLRYLKMVSLYKGPDTRAPQPWPLYVAENISTVSNPDRRVKLNDLFARYSKLPAAEKQSLEARANANREWNKREAVRWAKSYPIEVIYLANIARRRLIRITNKVRNYIHDDRQPKRPAGAMARFVRDRHDKTSGADQREVLKNVVNVWKGMSEAEKKPWLDQAEAEKARCKGQFDNFLAKAKQYWFNNKPKRRPTVPKIHSPSVTAKAKQAA